MQIQTFVGKKLGCSGQGWNIGPRPRAEKNKNPIF